MARRTAAAAAAAAAALLAVALAALGGSSGVAAADSAATKPRPIRGIQKSQVAAYTPVDGKFTCLSGERTIDFAAVNDDYCDCADGSDEPGTSACPNGVFYCRNIGFEGKLIPSSRVNDGVCDCCDGSDEHGGPTQCRNNCAELAAAKKAEEEAQRQAAQEGYARKLTLIADAAAARAEWQETAERLRQQLADIDKDILALEAEVEILEKAEKEALLSYEETESQHKACQPRIGEKYRKFHSRLDQAAQKVRNMIVNVEMQRAEGTSDADLVNNGVQDLRDLEHELSLLVQSSEQYMASAAGGADGDATADEEEHEDAEATDEDDDDDDEDDGRDRDADDWPPEVAEAVAKATEARKALSDTKSDRDRVKAQLEDLTKKLERDYLGRDYEFLPLAESCFSLENKEYVYEVCLFNKVEQRKASGGGHTRLGSWQGWASPNEYKTMKYTGGQKCWNGPERSTEVQLVCGLETKVLSVTEPAKCEYVAVLATPAACSPPPPPSPPPAGDGSHEHDEL